MMEDIKDLYAKRNEGDIVWNQVGQEIIIILTRENDEKVLRLNKTAGFIWEHCDGKKTVQQIVKDICQKYDVDETMAREEALALLNRMKKLQLVTLAAEPC
jgi:hypothetical protein